MPRSHGNWIRVSRKDPCPICGKPDNCEVSADGGMVWCGRIEQGSIRQNRGGQFLHRLKEQEWNQAPVRPTSRPKPKSDRIRDWERFAKHCAVGADEHIQRLARLLGVSYQSLIALGVGWHQEGRCWTFPERDAQGRVIGINARHLDGQKKRLSGSKSGLTYCNAWQDGVGPILLVEGGSDTAAAITMGLSAIGRPSNRAGVKLLADLLIDLPSDREIVVLGERDQKLDGKWPGRDGAVSVATQLAEELERPIGWALPPGNSKDARAWLQLNVDLPTDQLADIFVQGLEKATIDPPIIVVPEVRSGEAVRIDDWRQQMLRARIESLSSPGVYLDNSPTGAGKSWVDFKTVISMLRREAA